MQIQWPSKKGNIVWRTEPTVWLACVACSPFTASCHVCYFKDTQLHLTISCIEGRAARSTNREWQRGRRREKARGEREQTDEWREASFLRQSAALRVVSKSAFHQQGLLNWHRVSKVTDCIEVQWSQRIGINSTGIQPMAGFHFYKGY